MRTEILRFHLVLKIASDENLQNTLLKKNLFKCIVQRIEYKYKCLQYAQISEKKRINHDKIILRQIFHYQRLRELTELLNEINEKYNQKKNESQQKRERRERIRRELEELEDLKEDLKEELEDLKEEDEEEEDVASNSSKEYTPVVSKPKKKSMKKH